MSLRTSLGLLCVLLAPHAAAAADVFLVVAASSPTASGAAAAAARLAPVAPHGLVVAAADCDEGRAGFLVATMAAPGRDAAEQALKPLRKTAATAYIKRCEDKPGSLLSLRISAVDPSIADVPKDAVNWTDADRVSTVQSLDPQTFVIVVRRFADEPGDPLEGRRSRVLLARTGHETVRLSDTCFDPRDAAMNQDLIAMDCVREQAGSHLLHAVEVTTLAGRRVVEIPRCRTPTWPARQVLMCQGEEVGADDKLVERPRRVTIDRP